MKIQIAEKMSLQAVMNLFLEYRFVRKGSNGSGGGDKRGAVYRVCFLERYIVAIGVKERQIILSEIDIGCGGNIEHPVQSVIAERPGRYDEYDADAKGSQMRGAFRVRSQLLPIQCEIGDEHERR